MKSKLVVSCAGACALAVASPACAETFEWKVTGNVRSYTMTEDATFNTFDGITQSGGTVDNPNLYVLTLGGHTFTWKNTPWCTSGTTPSDRTAYPNPTLRMIGPGTASGNMDFGGNGNGTGDGLWLEDGVVWNGSFRVFGASRVVVKGGSKLNWNGWGLMSHLASSSGYILVEGAGSELRWTNGWTENCLHHDNSGLYLKDGATAVGYIVRLGDNTHLYIGAAGNHTTIEVDDSTFQTQVEFHLGGFHDPAKNPSGDTTDVKYPTLRMKGRHATVGPTENGKLNFFIYDQIGARIEYEVPKDGFVDGDGKARVPFRASSLTVHPDRPAGRSFIGDTVVSVKAIDWMTAHQGEKMTLFEVATAPSGDEMTWLASKVSFDDCDETLFDVPPSVAVSADGKSLVMTAADGIRPGAFFPSMSMSAALIAADEQRIKLTLDKMGALSSALTNLTLTVSKNADYSDATVVQLDPSSLAKAGDVLTHDLTGLELRTIYNVRADFVNDREKSGSCALVLATGGEAMAFKFNNAEGGAWEAPANWSAGEATATTWPVKGDKIGFGAHGSYTITSTGDKDVSAIALTTSDRGTEAPTVYTLDLGGGTLNLSGSSVFSCGPVAYQIDYLPIHPSLEIVNGTLTASSGKTIGFGYTGSSSGGVVIGRGGKWISGRGDFNSSSRLIVRDGGVVTADTYGFFWRSTNTGYGFVLATGEGSSYTCDGCFYANGDYSGLIVHDGAEVTLNGGLTVGNFNQPYFGHGAEHAFVEVSNATIRVKSSVKLGDIHEWHPDTQAGDTSDIRSPALRFAGTRPVFAPQVGQTAALTIYDGLDAEIAFAVPEAGYETVPLQASSLAWVERPDGEAYVNFGKTRFVVNCKEWMRANGGKSLTLVKLATPNKAGLERLLSKVSFNGRATVPPDVLTVSDDGTEIVLTARVSGLSIFIR